MRYSAYQANKANEILIFPDIVKAGLLVGGQYGEGAMRKNGKTVAYYRSFAGSFGLRAGVKSYGYVLFFMDNESLESNMIQHIESAASGDTTTIGKRIAVFWEDLMAREPL